MIHLDTDTFSPANLLLQTPLWQLISEAFVGLAWCLLAPLCVGAGSDPEIVRKRPALFTPASAPSDSIPQRVYHVRERFH